MGGRWGLARKMCGGYPLVYYILKSIVFLFSSGSFWLEALKKYCLIFIVSLLMTCCRLHLVELLCRKFRLFIMSFCRVLVLEIKILSWECHVNLFKNPFSWYQELLECLRPVRVSGPAGAVFVPVVL